MIMAFLLTVALFMAGCAGQSAPALNEAGSTEGEHAAIDPGLLAPIQLEAGETLQVVATSNLIADVVANVGGDAIELVALLPTGADPHSYTATPADLRAVNDAALIFVNGLGLEETLSPVLDSLDPGIPVVTVNRDVSTHTLGDEEDADSDHADDDHGHGGTDPHTWMDVANVMLWVDTIADALSAVSPEHASEFAANAQAYQADLTALADEVDAMVAELPVAQRKLVTDHDALGYFAAAHDFEIVGLVISSFSTLSSPSAQQLAALQDQITTENVHAIFVSTTVNPQLAEQIATDLGIQVVPLYIGSLSDQAGPAASYLDFMRYNTTAIVTALK